MGSCDLFFPGCDLVVMIIVVILGLPSTTSWDSQYYEDCGELYSCGYMSIDYPFWGNGRPSYCGHPRFHLTDCQNDIAPLITISSFDYRVLDINTSTYTLWLVSDDYWRSTCPRYLRNATTFDNDDYKPNFRYDSGTTDLMMYYNCHTTVENYVSDTNQFLCSWNGNSTQAFYALKGVGLSDGVSCETTVSVQIEEPDTASFNVTEVILDGFGVIWDAENSDCDACVRAGGRCGSSNSTSASFACFHQIESNGSKSPNIESNRSKFCPFRIGFVLCLAFGSSIVLIVALCLLIIFPRRHARSSASSTERPRKDNVEAFKQIKSSLTPKRYTYSKVKKITNSFKDKLGQGGFGAVFKGKLSDGRQVAVKVLNEIKADGEDFFNEVASIGRTSHVNVVTLLGFCFERKKRALIYEYMARGSLDKAIQQKLEWTMLSQIAVGIARGLEYLHRGCNTRIVHFDIKPHNILLDENFRPKISDFGLAKLCQSQQSKISMLGTRGTIGYIAPEVISRAFGCVSHKSDVFSYGMLLIEMTGLEKNKMEVVQTSEVYFPDWIYEHLEQGKDIGFHDASNVEDEKIAKKMVIVGLWCIQTNPLDRPPMSKVVEMLEGDLESLSNPPPSACLTWGNSSDPISNLPEILETESSSSKITLVPS